MEIFGSGSLYQWTQLETLSDAPAMMMTALAVQAGGIDKNRLASCQSGARQSV
jgi:hypothetical protein